MTDLLQQPATNLITETVDASSSTDTIYSISVGDSFSGELTTDDSDFIKVELSAGVVYTFQMMTSEDYNYGFWLLDGRGNLHSISYRLADGITEQVLAQPIESGAYYFWVSGNHSEAPSDYVIETAESGNFPPVGSLDEMAEQLTDGYWRDRGQTGQIFDDHQITVDITTLTDVGQSLARAAFEAWESVADIEFKEVQENAALPFSNDRPGAWANSLGVNVSVELENSHNIDVGGSLFSTYIHEIGHALGLGHLGHYPRNPSLPGYSFPADVIFSNDSNQVSVMSYVSQGFNPTITATSAENITPMIADIVAIQNLYGLPANGPTDGDTIWGYGSNTGTYLDDFFETVFLADGTIDRDQVYVSFTIFDTGGHDTLSLGATVRDQFVDIREESFSDIFGLVGNLVIARGTTIEDVETGSGSDRIIGNNADNMISSGGDNDFILSGSGNDYVYGGAGDDTLNGAADDDFLGGGEDDDSLLGEAGDDSLYGGNGNDTGDGGVGNDIIGGFFGDDVLSGNVGADEV